MAWIESLKERLPTMSGESLGLGLAIGLGGAALVLACLFPVAAAIAGAGVLAIAASAGLAGGRKGRKGDTQAGSWNNPTVKAGGYLWYADQQQERDSSHYQDLVSSRDQSSQSWER